jgi:nickel-dependent lactate racemase
MVDVWLPYGKIEICVRIPTRNFLGTIEPKEKPAIPDPKQELKRALREPIGTKQLGEIAKPEHRVAIVVDDSTRPAPATRLMVSALLDELNQAGIKNENVTIIFACGIHRAVTQEETARILGEEIVNKIKTVSHDAKGQDLAQMGTTRRQGTPLSLNRVFSEADVKILTGDVCFHYFAGYGGGRKSVLPGIAGEESIKQNHKMLLDSNAATGILQGNPVHEDMTDAASLAKVDFILNVVMSSKGELVKAFAGDVEHAFNEAVKLVDEMYRVSVDRKADVVVVSPGGNPADVNLFQAYKGIDSALDIVKRGGVIVLAAECPEGHGNQVFYDWMARFRDAHAVEKEIKRNFVLGGHKAYYLLEALQRVKIILVSSMPDYYAVNIFKLKTARGINNALNEALSIAGSNAKVWALPYGNFTLPEVKVAEETVLAPAAVK